MSSDAEQDETSFQADHLTTDDPPTYNEAAHQPSASGQTANTVDLLHQLGLNPYNLSQQQMYDLYNLSQQQMYNLSQQQMLPGLIQLQTLMQGQVGNIISTPPRARERGAPPPHAVRTDYVVIRSTARGQLPYRYVPYPFQSTAEQPNPYVAEVERYLKGRLLCGIFCTVVACICGTPITLLGTIPSLYCICKAKTYFKEGKIVEADSKSMTAITIFFLFFVVSQCIGIVLLLVTILPATLLSGV